jgi:hypothetical protein
MRRILVFMAAILLAPAFVSAQTPMKDLKPLFEAAQRLGVDNELRADIADRLGFGEQPLLIKDLVVTANGIQHAVNAFVVGDKAYILFDSHLHVPEVYVFVKNVDGTLVAGIHGHQGEPVTSAIDMREGDASVIGAEETFWSQWLANGAKAPLPK